jgi:hypothetical protein
MLKMKIAPQSSLKTKGQKSAPQKFKKINELSKYYDELVKGNDLR